MKNYSRYLITSALPYANGPLHIGHLAGAYLPADIYVRHLRMQGKEVAFICGSDEHGAAITLRAKKEGILPQEIVDKYHAINRDAFKDFGIDFDIYHRTTSPLHHETAQEYFKVLEEKGVFEIREGQQFYDEEHKQFLADRYVQGTCPNCGSDRAYGDQCENCGTSLSPLELINPVSTLSGATPVLKDTSHWYLPMQDHEAWLRSWIEEGTLDGKEHHDPKTWRNQVLGQCKSWIDGGLQPRAMTRDLDWGVKVPVKGGDGKVLYVWLDAPIGYISATRQWAADHGKDWKEYWSGDDTAMMHFIGKDNIVFHCIIFPILLKAHGELNLPINVPANEFLNLEGDKISTSRNWAIWLPEYLKDFPGKQDELRYVLTSIAPESKDSEFTWKDYQARVNNELVAILGNFVNRSVVLTHKYYDGEIPARGELSEYDQEVLAEIPKIKTRTEELLNSLKFREAQAEAMNLARLGNKYLADEEPWKKIKTDPDRTATILSIALEVTRELGTIFIPFLPSTAEKLQGVFQAEEGKIEKAGLLFQKVEDAQMEEQMAKLEASKAQPETAHEPQKEAVDFETFQQMDIRVGTILEAEKVPKANKLLKLLVDTGLDKRTVVSGIAEFYKPEEIVGKQVSVLLNLHPRKIRGVESQGMILMAEDKDGKLAFVSPESTMDSGSEVR
ncbi:methionine--tRNA ligase [bacterium SCSIO 12741]|nr:methionine--tRNA ligase [bacterium SCSIO 12741]